MKVGDKVRATTDGLDLTKGKIYEVCYHFADGGGIHFAVRDDVNDVNYEIANFYEPVIDESELEGLRAFRERALARYPSLAEPESDEDAAARIWRLYYDHDTPGEDVVREAIRWARANPR